MKKNKKHIVIFIPSFESGGMENSIVLISDILIKNGYQVNLYYLRKDGKIFNRLNPKIKKIKAKSFINLPMHPRINDAINILPAFWKYLLKIRKTHVVFSFQSNIIAILLCFLLRIKCIVRVASNPGLIQYENRIERFSHILKKYLYKYATAVITNSERTAKDLGNMIQREVISIYNPVYNKALLKKADEKVEHPWFVQKDIPIVITVARLSREKAIDTLIKACAIVQKKQRLRLVILGDGRIKVELEKLIDALGMEEFVWLPGFVENPYKFVKKADIFVLSSLYEGLPNALIEAISVGTPCISTNCISGPDEILLSGRGGDLVGIGDEKDMSSSILHYLEDKEYALKKWEVAFKALDRFSPEKISKKYISTLELL